MEHAKHQEQPTDEEKPTKEDSQDEEREGDAESDPEKAMRDKKGHLLLPYCITHSLIHEGDSVFKMLCQIFNI